LEKKISKKRENSTLNKPEFTYHNERMELMAQQLSSTFVGNEEL